MGLGKVRKRDLDILVATALGVPIKKVREITEMFLLQARAEITNQRVVHLDGFGKFHLSVQTGSRPTVNLLRGETKDTTLVPVATKIRVNFSKALAFKRQLQEMHLEDYEMEKYGVDESVEDQEDLEKKAADGCPECGREVQRHGGLLMCPVHGSEPFEKTDNGS